MRLSLRPLAASLFAAASLPALFATCGAAAQGSPSPCNERPAELLAGTTAAGRLRLVELETPSPLLFPGVPARVRLRVQNTGAVAISQVRGTLEAAEGVSVSEEPEAFDLPPGASHDVIWEVITATPGHHRLTATVSAGESGSVTAAAIAVSAAEPRADLTENRTPEVRALPAGGFLLRNRHYAAVLAGPNGAGPLFIHRAARPGERIAPLMAIAPALALTPAASEGGAPEPWLPASARATRRGLILQGAPASGREAAELEFRLDDSPRLRWIWRGGDPEGVVLLPLVTGLTGRRVSLLPGVAFTADAGTAPEWQSEQRPAPGLITVPVMAELGAEGLLAQLWLPGGGAPAPGVHYRPAAAGARPEMALLPAPGRELSGSILLRRNEQKITAALRDWEQLALDGRFLAPRKGDRPESRAARDLAVAALTGPLWKERGWVLRPAMDAALAQAYPGIELLLRQESGMRGGRDSDLIRIADLAAAARLGSAGGDVSLAYRTGRLAEALEQSRLAAQRSLNSMLASGAFIHPEGLPPAEAGLYHHAANLLPIIQHASMTGSVDLSGASSRGLEYLRREFTLPLAGTATSETEPSAFAAMAAAEAFLAGYRLTAEQQHLEQARYWADAATAFVYAWPGTAPSAQIGAARGAFTSLADPALPDAASFTRVAALLTNLLIRLDDIRDDSYYERVSERLLRWALDQQAESGAEAGMVRVARHPLSGSAMGGYESPHLLLAALHQEMDLGPVVVPVRRSIGPYRAFVASGATIEKTDTSSTRLRLDLRAPEGSSSYTTVIGVPVRPLSVSREGGWRGLSGDGRLPEVTGQADEGWLYDPSSNLLVVKLRAGREVEQVEIRWEDPRRSYPVDRVDLKAPGPDS